MPLYWRPQYYRRYRRTRYRNHRRPLRFRRPRKTFRYRFRRPRRVRRRRIFHKKLKKIVIKEWQPKKIVKCKVEGDIALFICGQSRIAHNFTNYKESYTPVGEASGGAWSIQQFTLDCLYSEYIKYRNFWTKSNLGLPLTRYTGATLKFYKTPFTDYIVTINTCPPFSVTKDMYFNTQPQRQLFERRKVLIPQLTSASKKKYKKIRIKPPSFMTTKWYFTQDICKQPLVVITAVACSFQQPYCPENQISNNITLLSLNTDFFQNPDFESNPTSDHGYVAKVVGTQHLRLFAHIDGHSQPKKWTDVVPLTRTNKYVSGKRPTSFQQFNDPQYWDNPFSIPHSHSDSILYFTDKWPTESTYSSEQVTFTPLENLYQECRYNPDRDTGINNIVYLKPNNHTATGTILDPPTNPNHIIKDYPLWMIFWSWTDWLINSKQVQDLLSGYFIVVKSPFIYPPKRCYVFLDKYFTNDEHKDLTHFDLLKWHPKYEMQEEVEFHFAETGPYAPKINRSQSIQANMNYCFYFKWGGCPAKMEHITSPCDQDKFPIPNSELQGLKIEDPKTKKETFLYQWDQRRDFITQRCQKRITENSTPELSITGISPFNVYHETFQEESDQETSEEEQETPLQLQLQQLRQQQHLLRHQLHRLAKRQKLE